MTHELVRKRYVFATNVDLNAVADVLEFPAIAPTEVYKFGIIPETLLDPDAGGFQIDLQLAPIAGIPNTGVSVDNIFRADAETVPAGQVLYKEDIQPVASAAGDDTLGGDPFGQGSVINVAPAGPLLVPPGSSAVLRVTNAVGAAVVGTVFMEIVELGFEPFHPKVTRDLP